MKIEIVRERRKTISLRLVDQSKLLVKAPIKLADDKVWEFIKSKESWINKHIAIMKSRANFAENFDLSNIIYRYSAPYMQAKDIVIGFDKLSDMRKRKAIKKQYLSMFDLVQARVKVLADMFGFKVSKISVMTSSYKWGSFSINGEMKLNLKLIILPARLIDYVIVHELCHSRHMNHKPQFWAEVSKYCKNYKELKKELEMYAFLLKTDF